MHLPNVYGPGSLFAFSGLDGPTDYHHDFTGSLLSDRIGIRFHLKVPRELAFELSTTVRDLEYTAVTSDLIDANLNGTSGSAEGRIVVLFDDARRVVGRSNPVARPFVRAEPVATCTTTATLTVHSNPGEHTAFISREEIGLISFAFGFSPHDRDDAIRYAQEGLERCERIDELVVDRNRYYQRLPRCPLEHEPEKRTLGKAFSVLKASIWSPCGRIRSLWTTPDRVPHRNMWLWDSVFHSLALRHVDPDLARQAIEAVLGAQHEDGFIPHMATPDTSSQITQPPLLAWGVWRLYQSTGNTSLLRDTYDRLHAYLRWNLKHRDRNHNYLFEWHIEDNTQCRSGESGMDNSPRFDSALDMDAVDFSSFMANEAGCMAEISQILQFDKDTAEWENLRTRIQERVTALLWDETEGFYFDRSVDGELNRVKAMSSFMPLFAGICEEHHAEQLVGHLLNPVEFRTALPVPSVACSEPSYSTDMWRGSVWANYNYLIIEGLRRYGHRTTADAIAARTIETIAYWYGQLGCIFEFYDSENRLLPSFLDRKGPCTPPYDLRRKIFPIRDYGWTAAVYVILTMEAES